MKVVVLAKEVPDTYADRTLDLENGMLQRDVLEPVPDEINERALESALLYKDANPDTEIIVVSMGPASAEKSLRKLLAMGADSAVLLSDDALAGSDMVQTARVLAAVVKKTGGDLIVTGALSTDGAGGMVPAMVAELLGHAYLPGLDSIEITSGGVVGTAQVDGGWMRLSADLPAAVSLTEKSADARFPNFKGIMQAKKKPFEIWSLADVGISAGPEAASVRSVMVAAAQRPPKQAGPKIHADETAAAQLAEFLAANRLI